MPVRQSESALGAAAELQFAKWVAASGGISAKPNLDKHGWDLFVELPTTPGKRVPLDKRPPPIALYVQMKGTQNVGLKRLSLKLSTASHLGRMSLPAAYVVLANPEGTFDSVERAWVIPVDAPHVEKLLRLLADAEQRKAAPSRVRFSEPLLSAYEIFPANRSAVIERLLRLVVSGTAIQGEVKQALNKTAGYEKRPLKVTFSRINLRQLGLAVLGLWERVDASGARFVERRFGISRKIAERAELKGEFHLVVGGGGAKVRVGFGQGCPPGNLISAELKSTEQVFRRPPPTLRGVRITSRLLDLVLTDIPGQMAGFLPPPPLAVDDKLPLPELVAFAENVRAIEAVVRSGEALCKVFVNGRELFQLPVAGWTLPLFGQEAEELIQATLRAASIVQSFGLPTNIEVSLRELLEQKVWLGVASQVLSGSSNHELEIQLSLGEETSKTLVVPGMVDITIGGNRIVLFYTLSGRAYPITKSQRKARPPRSQITHMLANPRVTVEAKELFGAEDGATLIQSTKRRDAMGIKTRYAGRADEALVPPPEFLALLNEANAKRRRASRKSAP